MGLSSELTIIVAAVGAVILLFAIDHYFRVHEERAEAGQASLEEPVETAPTYLDLSEESDEPNMAA